MTTEYINPKSNTTRKAAPQLLEQRAIPLCMGLAKEIGFIAAIILQHFYYLLVEGYGDYMTSDGDRWMHHPRREWVANHFPGLTEWQYRQGRDRLRQLGLLKTCQPRAREWNHTNYHTLDYESLKALMLSIGGLPPIDWRATTNRLVTAHQSIDPEQTSKQTSLTAAAAREKSQEDPRVGIPSAPPENRARETRQELDPGNKSKISSPDRSSAAAPSPVEKEKIDLVKGAGIEINPQITRELMKYTLDIVEAAVSHYSKVKRQKGKPTNPGGWLSSCLRGQWWLDEVEVYKETPYPYSNILTADSLPAVNCSPPPAEFKASIEALKQKLSIGKRSR